MDDIFGNGDDQRSAGTRAAVSVEAVRAVLERSTARGSARLVMLVLADHVNGADPAGGCWPSIARIAELSRLSPRHVRRCISELESAGELVREKQPGRRTWLFRLTLPEESGLLGPDRGDRSEATGLRSPDLEDRKGGLQRPGKAVFNDRQGGPQRPPNRNEPLKKRKKLALARARAGGTHERRAPETGPNTELHLGPDLTTRRRLRSMFQPSQGTATTSTRLGDAALATVLRLVRDDDDEAPWEHYADAPPHTDHDTPIWDPDEVEARPSQLLPLVVSWRTDAPLHIDKDWHHHEVLDP